MEVEEQENGNESMSEEEEDSSSDYDSDDDSSGDSGYGNLLENALFPPTRAAPVDTRTPSERWQEYLDKIRRRQTKVLKFVDPQLELELSILRTFDTDTDSSNMELVVDEGQQSWKAELLEAVTTAAVNPEDGAVSGYLTHAIVGREMLRLLGPDWQKQLFLAIASHSTLAYLELQSISYSARPNTVPVWDSRPSVLFMPAMIEALVAYPTPALSEMELLGVKFPSIQSVKQLAMVLEQRRASLRQVNIVGIEPPTPDEAAPKLTVGWLDPILLSLAARSSVDATGGNPLDELKLVMRQSSSQHNDTLTAITPQALSTLLQHKKKWWRLSLDGLGLGDDHLHVVTTMFRRDDTCKAGDLLCLERNPNITSRAYQEFFEGCFFWKRRMGLVKVDDKGWERQFDLVRSMNNLHNRLDYVVSTGSSHGIVGGSTKALEHQQSSPKCSFASRDKWVDWLVKLGTGLAWEDDKHRINYLWFTLLEKPEFIYSHA